MSTSIRPRIAYANGQVIRGILPVWSRTRWMTALSTFANSVETNRSLSSSVLDGTICSSGAIVSNGQTVLH